MLTFSETFGLVLVGALWGCTNPFLRKASTETTQSSTIPPAPREAQESLSNSVTGTLRSSIVETLPLFLRVQVWLPYVLNQCGSLVFYYTLARSDLSMAVPICNALALVFSILTSVGIGEKINHPIQTILGASCIMIGVTLCVRSSSSSNNSN